MAWTTRPGPVRTVQLPSGGTRMEFPGAEIVVRRPVKPWTPTPPGPRARDVAIRVAQRKARELAEQQQKQRDRQRQDARDRQRQQRRKDLTTSGTGGIRIGTGKKIGQFGAGPGRTGGIGLGGVGKTMPGRTRFPIKIPRYTPPPGYGAKFLISGTVNKVPGVTLPGIKPVPQLRKRKTTGWNGKYVFPVLGPCTLSSNWGTPRGRDKTGKPRTHKGIDIYAPDGAQIVAIVSGSIAHIQDSGRGGKMIFLRGDDGRSYGYAHLGDFAPGLRKGMRVNAGDVVATLGRTGVKRSGTHLHVQMYPTHRLDNSTLVNPYDLLQRQSSQVWGAPIILPRH